MVNTEKKPTKRQIDSVHNIELAYVQRLDDAMGTLHNTLVDAIKEAKLPNVQVMAVLQMLVSEATTMLMTQYIRE